MFRLQIRLLSFAIVLALVVVSSVVAQDTSGKLNGTVSDTTNAVVAGAVVSARNTDTNAVVNTVSGPAGAYTFASLPPGNYEVKCAQPGFTTFVATDVRIDTQSATSLNVRLQIGSAASEIRVEGTASHVETSTPTLETTLGTQSLLALPVQGRNLIGVAQSLQPGAVLVGNARGGSASFNGQRANAVSYKVDGGDVSNYFNGAVTETTTFPQAENLEEFTVVRSSNEAKYGSSNGAEVTATIKSGTNQLHGIGWLYQENQGWAANLWQNNRTGTPRPPGTQQWYGGNVGGPVFLPRLYDGRNHSFFFFSYERTSPKQFFSNNVTTPSAAERQGDFTNSLYGCPKINGAKTCQVDPASFSSIAKGILPLLPAGDSQGRFTWTPERALETNAFVVKGDQLFGTKHHFSGSYTRNFQNYTSNDFGTCCGLPDNIPGLTEVGNPKHISTWFFNHVYTISPTMVNTVSVGITHTLVDVDRSKIKDITYQSLGVPGVKTDKGAVPTDVNIWVNSWSGAGFSVFNGYFDGRTSDTANVQDDFVWIKGRHELEMGYQQRYNAQTKVGSWSAGGQISYGPGNAGSTGNPFADFLLDKGGEFNQGSGELVDRRYPSRSAFFQDRIKVSRRLTVIAGLRWDPFQGITELNNKFSVYRPGQQSTVYPNAPLGLLFYGDKGIGRAGYDNKWSNFNPRLGLSYDLTGKGKMAIRGSYGMYSDFLTIQDIALDAALPFSRSWSTTITPGTWHIGVDPYFGTAAFPFTPPAPGSAAAKSYVFPSDPQAIESYNPNFNSGRIHQWNGNFQWEPLTSYVFTFAYVGNRGTHLFGKDDINAPYFIPNASTSSNGQDRRPNPTFQSITERNSNLNSRYDSLQLNLNKRYAKGLSLLSSYTFGRANADGASVPNEPVATGYRDVRRRYLDYGPAGSDVRHVFSLSHNYELPFFKSSGRIQRSLLGGWIWGGIAHAQSGFPLTINNSAGFNAQTAGAYANYIGGNIYGDRSSRAAEADHYLNRAAFCPANTTVVNGQCEVDPTVGVTRLAYGNTGKGFARGPGAVGYDMTLSKNFVLSERWGKLEFRGAAFNVLNHTMLQNPNTSIDSGDFGRITSAAAPRQIQLSLRYRF